MPQALGKGPRPFSGPYKPQTKTTGLRYAANGADSARIVGAPLVGALASGVPTGSV
jgi:hypothetical protein